MHRNPMHFFCFISIFDYEKEFSINLSLNNWNLCQSYRNITGVKIVHM